MNKSISATTTKLTNLVLLAAMFVVITPMVLANTTTPATPTQSTIRPWEMPGQSPLRASYVPAYLAPYAEPNQAERPDFAVPDPNSFANPFAFNPGGGPITEISNVQPPVGFTEPSSKPVLWEVPGEAWVNPMGPQQPKAKPYRTARPVKQNIPQPQPTPAGSHKTDQSAHPVSGNLPRHVPSIWWGPTTSTTAPQYWSFGDEWPTSRWYNWQTTRQSLIAYSGNPTNSTRLERYAFNGKARFKR